MCRDKFSDITVENGEDGTCQFPYSIFGGRTLVPGCEGPQQSPLALCFLFQGFPSEIYSIDGNDWTDIHVLDQFDCVQETQTSIKQQQPDANFESVSKIVETMWQSLDEAQKEKYKWGL